MKALNISFLFVLIVAAADAQINELYVPKKDGSGFELTIKGASHLASLPLRCIGQEFPNKTNHTSNSDTDHVIASPVASCILRMF